MTFSYKWVVPLVLVAMGIGSWIYFQNRYNIKTEQGDSFENIVAPGISHQPVSLYDVQGNKLMLIQFWASWCGPCVRELPELKTVHDEFRNRKFRNADGFGVYMVSLDFDTAKWVYAIQRFQMADLQHVNERAAFKSPTALRLGVQAIPSNVLIDPQHRVIGVDLDMDDLEKTLERFAE